jgi:hypothetical protein
MYFWNKRVTFNVYLFYYTNFKKDDDIALGTSIYCPVICCVCVFFNPPYNQRVDNLILRRKYCVSMIPYTRVIQYVMQLLL